MPILGTPARLARQMQLDDPDDAVVVRLDMAFPLYFCSRQFPASKGPLAWYGPLLAWYARCYCGSLVADVAAVRFEGLDSLATALLPCSPRETQEDQGSLLEAEKKTREFTRQVTGSYGDSASAERGEPAG